MSAPEVDGAATLACLGTDQVAALEALLWMVEAVHVATEIAGLANAWDQVLRRNLAHVVHEIGAHEVQLGIARRQEELQARDHTLLADLRRELAGSGITVHPLVALPAAA